MADEFAIPTTRNRVASIRAALLVVLVIFTGSAGALRSADSAASETHPPLQKTRVKVVPPPPLKPSITRHVAISGDGETTRTDVGPPQYVGDVLAGSPDRLVVIRTTAPFNQPITRAQYALAAFDFRAKRWQRLPKTNDRPLALPDGLVTVGLPCRRIDESTESCGIEVSNLHWGDDVWRRQRVKTPAIALPSSDDAEIEFGVRALGTRNGFAYFYVYRDRDERILRVDVDGRVKTLPRPPTAVRPGSTPDSVVCVTPHGPDSIDVQYTQDAANQFGPIRRLDPRVAHPKWQELPSTDSLLVPGTKQVDCGANGLVFMHPPQTQAWLGRSLVTLATIGTPPPPSYAGLDARTSPLADGGFAFATSTEVHWLRDDRWRALPPFTEPGSDQLLSLTTVGDVIVYQVGIHNTGRTQLRIVP